MATLRDRHLNMGLYRALRLRRHRQEPLPERSAGAARRLWLLMAPHVAGFSHVGRANAKGGVCRHRVGQPHGGSILLRQDDGKGEPVIALRAHGLDRGRRQAWVPAHRLEKLPHGRARVLPHAKGNVRPRPGGSRALHGSHAINRLARETAGDDAGGGPCSRTAADARRLMRKDTSVRGPTEAGPSTGRTRPAVSGDCRGAVI
jgi:hypothetical protein